MRGTVALRPSAARDLEHCNEVLVQVLAAAGALVALSEGRVETVERGEWVNFVDSQRIAPAMSRHDKQGAAVHLVTIEGLIHIEATAGGRSGRDCDVTYRACVRDGLRAIEDNESMASTTAARRCYVKVVGGADGQSC